MNKDFIKPNFFVPGAGKSGTSSLHDYLNLHSDIYMSRNKEPHYFSNNKQFQQKEKYYSLFENGADKKYRGESSTGYMVFPGVIDRIKQEIKRPKFIFILRNPIDRCFSHYQWARGYAVETRCFRNAVEFDMFERPDPNNGFGGGYKYYYQFGLYGKHLKKFYDTFDRRDIYIITTDELKGNRVETLQRVFQFLGLPPLDNVPEIVSNKTIYYGNQIRCMAKLKALYQIGKIRLAASRAKAFIPGSLRRNFKNMAAETAMRMKNVSKASEKQRMTDKDRAWLQKLYEEDIIQLKSLTGMRFNEWPEFRD